MLKTTTVLNTWKCDGCGAEAVSEINPFYHMGVKHCAMTGDLKCILDLCGTCIGQITFQAVVDLKAQVDALPA